LQSARQAWRTSFRLSGEFLSFASPKERTKEKATPFPLEIPLENCRSEAKTELACCERQQAQTAVFLKPQSNIFQRLATTGPKSKKQSSTSQWLPQLLTHSGFPFEKWVAVVSN
jgi:hypothetical protein